MSEAENRTLTIINIPCFELKFNPFQPPADGVSIKETCRAISETLGQNMAMPVDAGGTAYLKNCGAEVINKFKESGQTTLPTLADLLIYIKNKVSPRDTQKEIK